MKAMAPPKIAIGKNSNRDTDRETQVEHREETVDLTRTNPIVQDILKLYDNKGVRNGARAGKLDGGQVAGKQRERDSSRR